MIEKPEVDLDGLVHAPTEPGIALPAGLDYPPALRPYVEDGRLATPLLPTLS